MKDIIWWLQGRPKHYFQVRFKYLDPNGRALASSICPVRSRDRTMVLNLREMKKAAGPVSGYIDRKHLCNGHLNVEVMAYLGKFTERQIKKMEEKS